MSKKEYKITTNPVSLSRAWTALSMVEQTSTGIPHIDVGDSKEELAMMLLLSLGTLPEAYNMFIGAVTGQQGKDFSHIDEKEAVDIVVNFCESITPTYLSLIRKFMQESKKRRDIITAKMQKQIQEKMEEIMKDPAKLESLLKQ